MDRRKSCWSMLIHFLGQNVVDSLFFDLMFANLCDGWSNVGKMFEESGGCCCGPYQYMSTLLSGCWMRHLRLEALLTMWSLFQKCTLYQSWLEPRTWQQIIYILIWCSATFRKPCCHLSGYLIQLTLKFSSDFLQNFRSHRGHILAESRCLFFAHQVEVFKIRTLDLPWKTYPRPILWLSL